MLENNNIWYFFLAILPAAIYSFIIYLSTPYRSVKFIKSLKFLVIGLVSPIIVLSLHFIFPNWGHEVSINRIFSTMFMAFIQVALLEELAKFVTFKFSESLHKETIYPTTTMFYACMASTGFAVFENVHYLSSMYSFWEPLINVGIYDQADQSIMGLLKVRAFSAIILHMICGIFMGYFIALGRMNTNIENPSVINLFLKRHTRIKRLIYSSFGIAVAILYHGLYDWNLFVDNNPDSLFFLILIICSGLLISFLMGRHLRKETLKLMRV